MKESHLDMGRPRQIVEPKPDWIAIGKGLREKVPREQHGRWEDFEGRPDPIELLHKADAGRMKELIPIRYSRMLHSPFAFYRGSAGIMAADLARTPTTGLKVQACGDFASITLAARSNGLSDAQGRDCPVSCAQMYREHMRKFSKMDPLRIWYEETSATEFINSLPEVLQKRVRKRIEKTAAHSGSEFDLPKLTGSVGEQIRITDQPPLIFHPEITSASDATTAVNELFGNYRESLPDDRRILDCIGWWMLRLKSSVSVASDGDAGSH